MSYQGLAHRFFKAEPPNIFFYVNTTPVCGSPWCLNVLNLFLRVCDSTCARPPRRRRRITLHHTRHQPSALSSCSLLTCMHDIAKSCHRRDHAAGGIRQACVGGCPGEGGEEDGAAPTQRPPPDCTVFHMQPSASASTLVLELPDGIASDARSMNAGALVAGIHAAPVGRRFGQGRGAVQDGPGSRTAPCKRLASPGSAAGAA